MDKVLLKNMVIEDLQKVYDLLTSAAEDAKLAATGDESKAENKYDTRGLEASYLAAGQAKRAEDLRQSLQYLKTLGVVNFKADQAIALTAVVNVKVNDVKEQTFFILPEAGGSQIHFSGRNITILSVKSPLGSALLGKHLGEVVELEIQGQLKTYEIISIE